MPPLILKEASASYVAAAPEQALTTLALLSKPSISSVFSALKQTTLTPRAVPPLSFSAFPHKAPE